MKIWYQSFSRIGIDPKWSYYEKTLKAHIEKVSRPDTVVELHGVEKLHPKFTQYNYFLGLHGRQVIDNALRAEQEGYDAFIAGGMLDPGYFELKEVLDIPVAFLAESTYHVACILASKFAVIGSPDEVALRKIEARIKSYGLEQHWVPGVHLGTMTLMQQVEDFTNNPKGLIETVTEGARESIRQGADILIAWSGTLGTFLTDHDVTEIDGVPVLDTVQVVIGMAEFLVDLKRNGITRSKKGIFGAPTKEEVIEARKIYGA